METPLHHDSEPEKKPTTDWLDQRCSIPGCEVLIRSKLGHQQPGPPICKWHQAGTAYYAKSASMATANTGPLLSLEEFGRDLYDAIRLNSARIQCEHNAELWAKKGKDAQAKDESAKADHYHTELQVLLSRDTIAPADLKRISDMR